MIMESIINAYISRELVSKPDQLPLKNDTQLLDTGLLDSLSVLKLVLFLEKEFGIVMDPEDVIPEHFQTVDAICTYVRTRRQAQEV